MNINKLKNERGFTIVELLIVIVVIAILAAITIVAFNGVQQRARDAERASDVSNITKALSTYIADGNDAPTNAAGVVSALGAYETVSVGSETLAKLSDTAPGSGEAARDNYHYEPCGVTGAEITYWIEAEGTAVNPPMRAGSC